MIFRLLFPALTFIEADFLLKVRKKRAFGRALAVWTGGWVCFNILFFIPLIFSSRSIMGSAVIFTLLSLFLPAVFLLRSHLIGYSENTLLRRITSSEADKKRLTALLREKTSIALTLFLLSFSLLFGYALAVSFIFLLFGAITLSLFFIQLAVSAISSIIILILFVFRRYLFGKNWKWVRKGFIKLFGFAGFPVAAALAEALFLILISPFYFTGWNASIAAVVLSGIFFSLPLLNSIFRDKRLFVPFRFTVFLFLSVLIIVFFSPLASAIGRLPGLSCGMIDEMIRPLVTALSYYSGICLSVVRGIPLPLFIFLPFTFFPLLAVNRGIYEAAYVIRKQYERYRHKNVFGRKTRVSFSGALSPYRAFFSLSAAVIIGYILFLEARPVSRLLLDFTGALRMTEKSGSFGMTADIIYRSVDILFTAITVILLLRGIAGILYSLRSLLFLSEDEFVFSEKRILSSTLHRIPLKTITHIIVRQSALDRCFDTGVLVIRTSGSGKDIRIHGMSFIRERQRLLMEKVMGPD
ncbi:MAG: PH domain-containing protein [Spirochaetales bacterium]|nr:PH domain-containing protein [Spirochaetales bacterium]